MASIKLYKGSFGHVSLLSAASNLVTHAHPEAHIIIWVDGDPGEMMVSGHRVRPGPEHAIGINSLEPHSHSFAAGCAPGRFLAFYIDPQWVAGRSGQASDARLFHRPDFPLDPWLRDFAIHLFQRIETDPGEEALAHYEIERLIDRLFEVARAAEPARHHARHGGVGDFRVRKAIEKMRANVSGRMNFDELARSVGLSRPHFFALFKEHTQLTPNVFWNTLRMEEALKQLESSEESLTSVACQLGFTTQGNFTRFFRDHAGVPPTLYREAARPDVF
ncbi:MAG: helix-turn-helix transcriptional regulator [Rhizobiales bacterium]|nr:helix-turn-helix transcriptional regulator [Hyphomicrobiales bacterium]